MFPLLWKTSFSGWYFFQCWKKDPFKCSFQHCGGWIWISWFGTWPTWLCCQVLHRRGELGFGWQQHTHLLHPWPLSISKLHSHTKEESSDSPQGIFNFYFLLKTCKTLSCYYYPLSSSPTINSSIYLKDK